MDTFSSVSLRFSPCNSSLLISKSKFSGNRKFTLRYQWVEKNLDFKMSRVDCNRVFSVHEFSLNLKEYIDCKKRLWSYRGYRNAAENDLVKNLQDSAILANDLKTKTKSLFFLTESLISGLQSPLINNCLLFIDIKCRYHKFAYFIILMLIL